MSDGMPPVVMYRDTRTGRYDWSTQAFWDGGTWEGYTLREEVARLDLIDAVIQCQAFNKIVGGSDE